MDSDRVVAGGDAGVAEGVEVRGAEGGDEVVGEEAESLHVGRRGPRGGGQVLWRHHDAAAAAVFGVEFVVWVYFPCFHYW